MAADSAVSVEYDGLPHRVENIEDHDKIITHFGHMIFCSGNLDRCKDLRCYIKSLRMVDCDEISRYAQRLWEKDPYDNSTGLFVCRPDNTLLGMLSAQNFRVTHLPMKHSQLDIQTLGFHMNEAYIKACLQVKTQNSINAMVSTFNGVACEEVGGAVHLFSRVRGGDIVHKKVPLSDPYGIRKGVFICQ